MTPRATYRLQFHAGFRFSDATFLAPYLADLGVSHIYTSPFLKAQPGSAHGYDVTDHRSLNPELGDGKDFDAMTEGFAAAGLGQIADFVPNHMGIGGADNRLWLDVLEWGPQSDHANWFDIDWDPDNYLLKNKVLAPFLANQYGVELETGKLQLKFDGEEGSLAIWAYGAHKLPICPGHYHIVLRHDTEALDRLGDLFADLEHWRPEHRKHAEVLKAELAALIRDRSDCRASLESSIGFLNSDWPSLDGLIKQQFWCAAWFGVASDDINYRRFFNISDLAALRIESPAVFQYAHARILPMIESGVLEGLRIDHIDGLFDPKGYLDELRAAVDRPFYLWVEKILASEESLPTDWKVEGTTGYEFANLILGVLIDLDHEGDFTQIYESFTGLTAPFGQISHQSKMQIMDNEMASELYALARDAARVAQKNPMTVDFTPKILQRAIKQIIACFPVYRTYVSTDRHASDADRGYLERAIAQARRMHPLMDQAVFDFVRKALLGELTASPKSGYSRTRLLRFIMRFQQCSGPIMAKGLEDTAFYRYNRFLALNEVGGDPQRFGISKATFENANHERAAKAPLTMLATSTHDTKRGEDARARLAVLSEMPADWADQVRTWTRILRSQSGAVESGTLPDRNDEYQFYQHLVGSWPVELLDSPDPSCLDLYTARVNGTLRKSMREAKVHSSWGCPNLDYENATLSFAATALKAEGANRFLASFLPFVRRVAKLGMENSLAQVTLKLTVPGVPDIYQGCELWDFNLVDPDNRRPVDFKARQIALDQVRLMLLKHPDITMGHLFHDWRNGHIKLAITALLLELRKAKPLLFQCSDYVPLAISGDLSECVLGFVRANGNDALVGLVARYPARREAEHGWSDTSVILPAGNWTDVFTRQCFHDGQRLPMRSIFSTLPVAILYRTDGHFPDPQSTQ